MKNRCWFLRFLPIRLSESIARAGTRKKHVCMFYMSLSKRWIPVIILTSYIIYGQSLGFSILVSKALGSTIFPQAVLTFSSVNYCYNGTSSWSDLHRYMCDFQSVFRGANSGANYSSLFSMETCRILFHLNREPISNSRRILCVLKCKLKSVPRKASL